MLALRGYMRVTWAMKSRQEKCTCLPWKYPVGDEVFQVNVQLSFKAYFRTRLILLKIDTVKVRPISADPLPVDKNCRLEMDLPPDSIPP